MSPIAHNSGKQWRSREYPSVLAVSRDVSALLTAHSTEISQQEALNLIFSYLDEDECSEVRFQRASATGYAKRGGEMLLSKRPTVGLVLHETAHYIQFQEAPIKRINGRRLVHGEDYTKILDRLIASEIEWEKHPYTAKEIFSKSPLGEVKIEGGVITGHSAD